MANNINALLSGQKKAPEPDKHLEFEARSIIFSKGDPGGDIYFIEAGTVEIYDMKDAKEIPLADMNAGEILGLLTCLNNAPRSAYARAKNAVRLKQVSHEKIRASLQNTPSWLNIILKEFSIRLKNTNEALGVKTLELEDARKRELTALFLGKQFAAVLSTLAETFTITVDGQKFVPVQESQEKIIEMLCVEPFIVIAIYHAFQNSGLIKVEIEPDKKRKVIPQVIAQNCKDFLAFCTKAQAMPLKKLVRTSIPDKSFRIVTALVAFAKKQNLNPKEKVTLASTDLNMRLEKATGTAFDLEALKVFTEFKLIAVSDGSNEADKRITFTPSSLGRMMAHLRLYKSLTELRLKELEAQQKNTQKEAAS